jgi:EGF domain
MTQCVASKVLGSVAVELYHVSARMHVTMNFSVVSFCIAVFQEEALLNCSVDTLCSGDCTIVSLGSVINHNISSGWESFDQRFAELLAKFSSIWTRDISLRHRHKVQCLSVLVCYSWRYLDCIALVSLIDVDECDSNDTATCSQNARCTNTRGSYICECNLGYNGNGFNCSGISMGDFVSVQSVTLLTSCR